MPDQVPVAPVVSTPNSSQTKGPEIGRPLDLPGDRNSGWSVAGVDRYGSVLLTRPSGQGLEKHPPINAEMYQRLIKTPANKKKIYIKPKFALDQRFQIDRGSFSPIAIDGHAQRALVTGMVNGQSTQEWVDLKMLNLLAVNPEAGRVAFAKYFGQDVSEKKPIDKKTPQVIRLPTVPEAKPTETIKKPESKPAPVTKIPDEEDDASDDNEHRKELPHEQSEKRTDDRIQSLRDEEPNKTSDIKAHTDALQNKIVSTTNEVSASNEIKPQTIGSGQTVSEPSRSASIQVSTQGAQNGVRKISRKVRDAGSPETKAESAQVNVSMESNGEQTTKQTREELRQQYELSATSSAPSAGSSTTSPTKITIQATLPTAPASQTNTVSPQAMKTHVDFLLQAGGTRSAQLESQIARIQDFKKTAIKNIKSISATLRHEQQSGVQTPMSQTQNSEMKQNKSEGSRENLLQERRDYTSLHLQLTGQEMQIRKKLDALSRNMRTVQGAIQPTEEMLRALIDTIPLDLLRATQKPTIEIEIDSNNSLPNSVPSSRISLGIPSTGIRNIQTDQQAHGASAKPFRPLNTLQTPTRSSPSSQNTSSSDHGDTSLSDSYEQGLSNTGGHPTHDFSHQGGTHRGAGGGTGFFALDRSGGENDEDTQDLSDAERQQRFLQARQRLADSSQKSTTQRADENEQNGENEQNTNQPQDQDPGSDGNSSSPRSEADRASDMAQQQSRARADQRSPTQQPTKSPLKPKTSGNTAPSKKMAGNSFKFGKGAGISIVGLLLTLLLMNIQLINKIYPKNPNIPTSKTYEDLITICCDLLLLILVIMIIAIPVIIIGGIVGAILP